MLASGVAIAQTTNTFPASGNVGIGTTSPQFKLDVIGQIHSSTGFVFPDGSSQVTAYNPNAPLSINGRFSINASGSDAPNSAAFLVNDTETPTNGWMIPSAIVSVNAVNGTNVIQDICAFDFSLGDCAYWGLNYTGHESSSNLLTFGLTGSDHLLNILPSGNVGIGTMAPGARLEVNGNLKLTASSGASITFQDGTVQTTAYTGVACGGDYAESVDAAGERNRYKPGDLLVLTDDGNGDVTKSTEPYSTMVAGVYSTRPGYVGRRQTGPRNSDEIPMAMVGIVPTRVSAENGPVHRGDLLVTASLEGYAMKGTDRSRMLGAVIGKAMGSLDSGTGVIEVLVTLQ
ncbi:hypothetical protein [Paracidobacterium acidisoli]|uniref:Uncharacterized protein n=1 Tax=Paracidobacterium acidisoli TaxID=2303751 RepID=A0A372IIW4_9BACT|nr:hypothetical protein [Paracidobacterium acidisoli]MBT9333386.1 hypothetical protein [Paracidobacterium acidisoli]